MGFLSNGKYINTGDTLNSWAILSGESHCMEAEDIVLVKGGRPRVSIRTS